MAPQVQRPDPAYLQISRHIRQQILDGELGDGELAPSARAIMKEWGVAMATAMRAIDALKTEGLVRAAPGIGTIVTRPDTHKQTPEDRVGTMRRTGRIYPTNERAQISSAGLVAAPEHVAEALGVEAGAQVIRRQRITYRDDVPVSASVSWMPGDLAKTAPKLLETDRIIQGTFGYVEEVTGRTVTGGTDKKSADAASEQDASDLQVPVGSPVLRGQNWMYDQNGAVLEYGESTAIPGRWTTYQYEIGD